MKTFEWIIYKKIHSKLGGYTHWVHLWCTQWILNSKEQNADLQSINPRQDTDFWGIKRRPTNNGRRRQQKIVFVESLIVQKQWLDRLIFKAFLIKIKNCKLDLESLGRLFQNQPKDWRLVGDGYPRVHWKDKRPQERPVGPIIRKVTSSWAEGGTPAKVGWHKIRLTQAQTARWVWMATATRTRPSRAGASYIGTERG
jgi:hypothetical protein